MATNPKQLQPITSRAEESTDDNNGEGHGHVVQINDGDCENEEDERGDETENTDDRCDSAREVPDKRSG